MTTKTKTTAFTALSAVQARLNAPKGQYNNFGKYAYRNCEDILQAVKGLLGDAVIVLSDEIKLIGDRYYIEATAKFILDGVAIENKAYAREPFSKKGMDDCQITGSASSYARKYALNGLLLIDDNKDADSHDNRSQPQVQQPQAKPKAKEHYPQERFTANLGKWSQMLQAGSTTPEGIIKRIEKDAILSDEQKQQVFNLAQGAAA